jgi:hypothetical protein
MKRLLPLLALAGVSCFAAEWTGYVVDKNCASKKEMWTNEACAQSCIKRGTPAVFVTEDGTVYQVSNQDKVKEHAGHKVTITGKMDGDTITVDDVKM